MEDVYIVVGLGNPGSRYDNTKHNVGFETIDLLAKRHGIKVSKIKYKGLWGDGIIDGKRVILLKPQTYMNLSGESVLEAVNWFKPEINKLILVYDDVDVEMGKIRIRPKGSSGSHNGMKSIIYLLNRDEFPRVRIGIGKPPPYFDMADYVLSKFNKDERITIDESLLKATNAIEELIKNGIDSTMNRYNP